jgi:hypothetical protein
MSIPPIETRYKGYRFRSRLEARWAVFFEAARIAWEYEKDGYKIKGWAYLPDFYLPEHEAFFEVKGALDYDESLLQGLADLTGKQVILAVGNIPPSDHSDEDWSGFRTFFPGGDTEDDSALVWGDNDTFLTCDGCGRVRLINSVYASMKGTCCEGSRLSLLGHAFEAARSARFEHG